MAQTLGSMPDNDIRVLRVIRERRVYAAQCLIFTGVVLIVAGVTVAFWYVRPGLVYLLAIPVVFGVLCAWRWYVWSSV